MGSAFYVLRFVICLVSLGYASARDLAAREVGDWVWVVGVPACLLLDVFDACLCGLSVVNLLASLGISLLVGVTLSRLGFFGGADAWALLLIAAAMPSYVHVPSLLLARALLLPLVFIFFSAVVLSALYPLTILILNLSDLLRGRPLLRGLEVKHWSGKLLLYATVRRVNLKQLHNSLKHFPAEKVVLEDGKPVRRPVYFVGAGADVAERLKSLEAHPQLFEDGVLASPTIPMVVFLTFGFVSASVVEVSHFI